MKMMSERGIDISRETPQSPLKQAAMQKLFAQKKRGHGGKKDRLDFKDFYYIVVQIACRLFPAETANKSFIALFKAVLVDNTNTI